MRGLPPTPRPHEPERICAFYSKGPHFVRMMRRLRDEYPGETIVAAIPAGYPFPAIETLADETVRLPEGAGPWTVLRRLRQARCSHMVVMFDSPRLNLLARLSGCGCRWCYSVDGQLQLLNRSLPGLLIRAARLRVWGEIACLRARVGTARRAKPRE